MEELIRFLLKSIVVSGLLCTWYLLALKNKRLHNYNRFFLLFTLYASIQLPLLHFSWSPVYEDPPALFSSAGVMLHTYIDTGSVQEVSQQVPAAEINWPALLMILAVLVSFGLLVTMIVRIVWVIQTGKKYPFTIKDGIRLIQTDLTKAPFSFMNRIFWREGISTETESGRMILRHELAHVKQKHTYDKLLSQLLTCLFWMNPFYWFIRKELGIVHEFIADEQAIVKNEEGLQEEEYTQAFAKMLLHVHSQKDYFNPGHQFFSSPIKRRLIMLQKNRTVRASVLRRMAVVPLIAAAIFLFAFSPRAAEKRAVIKSDKKLVLVVDAGHGGEDAGCRSGSLIEKELNLKMAKRIEKLAPAYNIEVHLTRSSDEFLSLEERVAFSNRLQPDDLLSLHVNDQPGKEAGNGTFDIAVNTKNAKAEESQQLAYAIYAHASRPEWEQTNTLSDKNPYVLKESTTATALIQVGDIKNKKQMRHLEEEAKLDELCRHILEGIVEAHEK
jgi:N-acetylmuramoyl-L-alanine amidase